MTPSRLRVVTYNIHKCRGLDRRTSPPRIIAVLKELDADILCLQEVVNAPGTHLYDQAGEIERALPEYIHRFGANRPLHGGTYGNLTLSRLPIRAWHNHDLTSRREERGVLQTDIEFGPQLLHVFNVHLGTGFNERRRQARVLLGEKILANPQLTAPRLVVGDLNEWTRGLTTHLAPRDLPDLQPAPHPAPPGDIPRPAARGHTRPLLLRGSARAHRIPPRAHTHRARRLRPPAALRRLRHRHTIARDHSMDRADIR